MADTPGSAERIEAAEQPGQAGPAGRQPPPPSPFDAILPIVVLIGLLILTIVYFGLAATDGPLQVALFLSAAFASLIAFRNSYTAEAIAQAVVRAVGAALAALFNQVAVVALMDS